MNRFPFIFFVSVFLVLFLPDSGIQLLSIFVCTVILFAFISSFHLKRSLRIFRKEETIRTFQNQKVEIELIIENKTIFGAPYLYVEDEFQNMFGGEGSRKVISLKPTGKTNIRYSVVCRDRGCFTVGPVVVRGSDVLGLFPWTVKPDVFTRIIVYPQVLNQRYSFLKGLPSGNIRISDPVYEDVTRYRSMREYRNGDSLRRIHWNVSAKAGKLYTKEFLPSMNSSALVFLNLYPPAYALKLRSHRFERAVDTAATLIFSFIQKQQAVGLVIDGNISDAVFPVKAGESHAMAMLEALALLKQHDQSSPLSYPPVEVPFGCRILYVGPLLDEQEISDFISRWNMGEKFDFFFISTDREKKVKQIPERIRYFNVTDYGMELCNG